MGCDSDLGFGLGVGFGVWGLGFGFGVWVWVWVWVRDGSHQLFLVLEVLEEGVLAEEVLGTALHPAAQRR